MAVHVNINRDQVECLQKRSFAEGAAWLIDRASLRALFDMGLTAAQIARYFSIDPIEVQAVLNSH
jgi:hypothetical protein